VLGLAAVGLAAGGLWWYKRSCKEREATRNFGTDADTVAQNEDGHAVADGSMKKNNWKTRGAVACGMIAVGCIVVAVDYAQRAYYLSPPGGVIK
jgi:hypothetical protein